MIAIIAEGIPENKTRELNAAAHRLGKHIIGPATVRLPPPPLPSCNRQPCPCRSHTYPRQVCSWSLL